MKENEIMKVKELREILEKCRDDYEVILCYYGPHDATTISSIGHWCFNGPCIQLETNDWAERNKK